jgi:MFS family permease
MPGNLFVLRYLGAAFFARLANDGMPVATVMLALDRTGSTAQGAFVLMAWMAPHVVVAPLVGAMLDRSGRPQLVFLGALGVLSLVLAVLAEGIGRLPLLAVLAVAAAGGCCGPVVTGGFSSLIARLLPPGGQRDRAYSWDATSYSAAAIGGSGSASLVGSALSPGTAMLLLSTAPAVAAVLTLLLPRRSETVAHQGTAIPIPQALAAGVRSVWRIRELRAITAATGLAFVGMGALSTTSVLIAGNLGRDEAGGLLMTAFAIGSLAATLGIARLRSAPFPQRLSVIGMIGVGTALAAAGLAPVLPLVAVCFAVAGAGDGLVATATLRIRADHSPSHWRTQVFTIGAGLKITAAAFGASLAGLATAETAHGYLIGIAFLQIAAALLHKLLQRSAAARHPHSFTHDHPGAEAAQSTRE